MIIKIGQPRSFSNIGRRANQEDARMPDVDMPESARTVFAVCDGVGGIDKGEVASATVAKAIDDLTKDFHSATKIDMEMIHRIIVGCYKSLMDISKRYGDGMATTLAMLIFNRAGCYAVHIGDSRIYQLRPGSGIVYRSRDHSLVTDLVEAGLLTPEAALTHPRKNVITRCIRVPNPGEEPSQATTALLTDIRPGDLFLICSDGVLEAMPEDVLVRLLTDIRTPFEIRVKELCEECIRKSNDNNTAIVIPIDDASGGEDQTERQILTRETCFTLSDTSFNRPFMKKITGLFRKLIDKD